MENAVQAVTEIIAKHLGRKENEINAQTTLVALQIDSLDMTEIIFNLEEKFDIQIPDSMSIGERLNPSSTIGDLATVVQGLIQQKN